MNEVFAENLLLWILIGTVGGASVGWWLCKKIKFGDAEMRVHEQRIRERLEQSARELESSRIRQRAAIQINVGTKTLRKPEAVARAPNVEASFIDDPFPGMLAPGALTDSPHAQADATPHHESPACSSSHDAGSSSSDCGSSSDSGGSSSRVD